MCIKSLIGRIGETYIRGVFQQVLKTDFRRLTADVQDDLTTEKRLKF